LSPEPRFREEEVIDDKIEKELDVFDKYMQVTTISPKNQFKQIINQVKNKELDQKTCNFMQGYF
jgi:hypothetical protein